MFDIGCQFESDSPLIFKKENMNIYLVADTHFSHFNIMKYCKRPFSTVEEMNEVMIDNWNKLVRPNDEIYHLGDFGFGSHEKIKEIRKKLNGKIHLILGNHDIKGRLDKLRVWESVQHAKHIKGLDKPLYAVHYCPKVWYNSHYNSYGIYGHSHGGLNSYAEKEGKLLDVGVDTNNFKPYHLDEVLEIMKTRPDNFNYIKRRTT